MSIDFVLVSGDCVSDYADFWGPVSFAWKHVVGVEPVLIFVSDTEETDIQPSPSGCGFVKMVKRVQGVPIALQAQVARLYAASFFPEARCLTSDLDMLPLSADYFLHTASAVPRTAWGVWSADAYAGEILPAYPMCYHLALGSVYSEVLGLDRSFEAFLQSLPFEETGWNTDEQHVYSRLRDWPGEVVHFARGWPGGFAARRLDRAFWRFDPEAIRAGHFIDCHSLRPYKTYRLEVDAVLRALLPECYPELVESTDRALEWTQRHRCET